MNRLKLDFSLETAEERKNFIDTYITQFPDLTHTEAETIANYLLWGKDESGTPIGADTELKTRWTKTTDLDSLDEVLENPALVNVQFAPLTEAVPLRKVRQTFDRAQVRETMPDYLRDSFETLWRHIDTDDLLINYYELETGKRTKPPREELLRRFTEEEQRTLSLKAAELSQFAYLKLRHEIVELRQEQFTLRDSFISTISNHQGLPGLRQSYQKFGLALEVLPLGVKGGPLGDLIFQPNFDPRALNIGQVGLIQDLIKDRENVESGVTTIDFRNLETLYQLYLNRSLCEEQIEQENEAHFIEGSLSDVYRTLDFYESITNLTPAQHRLLRLKEAGYRNAEIAELINEEYGKSYTANYISTVFRQKTLTKIVDAVKLHEDTVKACGDLDRYKVCTRCGKILLLDERNFVHKNRSKDGFQNRCKMCEREVRKEKNKED